VSTFAAIVILSLLFAVSLWGAVKIIDRYNTRNKPAMAAVIGVVFAVFVPTFGFFFVAFPLMALLFVMVFYYDLGYARGIIAIILMCVLMYVGARVVASLLSQFGTSTAGMWGLVAFVGVVSGVIFWKRGSFGDMSKGGQKDKLPKAYARRSREKATQKKQPTGGPGPAPRRAGPVAGERERAPAMPRQGAESSNTTNHQPAAAAQAFEQAESRPESQPDSTSPASGLGTDPDPDGPRFLR